MANDLANLETNGMSLVPQNVSEQQIQELASANDYFKRLQLMGSNSAAAKEGIIGMGNYALVTDKENMKDIGKEIDVLVCAMRFKALEIAEDGVITIFDPNDSEFARIRERSSDKDSGCMCGLEFLLWLPSEEDFSTFFMASKSQRRIAPQLRAKINEAENKPGPATLKVKLAKNTKYSWHVPTVHDCSTPFNLPTTEDLVKSVDKFLNPPKNEVETVDDEEGTERAR